MAYKLTKIPLTQGDTLPPIDLTVYDSEHAMPGKTLNKVDPSTWSRINLSKVEQVILLFKAVESYADPVEIPCKITNAMMGDLTVEWREGDLDEVGEYEGRLQIYYYDYENAETDVPMRLLRWTAKTTIDFEIEPVFT